jgi:hypothetical protein
MPRSFIPFNLVLIADYREEWRFPNFWADLLRSTYNTCLTKTSASLSAKPFLSQFLNMMVEIYKTDGLDVTRLLLN